LLLLLPLLFASECVQEAAAAIAIAANFHRLLLLLRLATNLHAFICA
jgi:hypothetical protein